jgi:hypothetical protein
MKFKYTSMAEAIEHYAECGYTTIAECADGTRAMTKCATEDGITIDVTSRPCVTIWTDVLTGQVKAEEF